MSMSSVVWLVSYHKSGNTWLRIFLANLLNNRQDVNFNDLKSCFIASDRAKFDGILGVESSDLTMDEIDNLRPDVYEHIIKTTDKPTFIKVHDAYTYLPNGRPLFGNLPLKIIYILRNPLDVAVSLAHHRQKDIDDTINLMGDPAACFCNGKDKFQHQLRQRVLSWSMHVESWINSPGTDILLIKYEEMKTATVETFSKVVRFIGLPYDEEQIRRAAALSDFNLLKNKEKDSGFLEAPEGVTFFREGSVGGWRKNLTEEQKNKIVENHYKVMKEFGYLDDI